MFTDQCARGIIYAVATITVNPHTTFSVQFNQLNEKHTSVKIVLEDNLAFLATLQRITNKSPHPYLTHPTDLYTSAAITQHMYAKPARNRER
jgi:hypothetical protein